MIDGNLVSFGLVVIFVYLLSRFLVRQNERSVRRYFYNQGEKLLTVHWSPFGPGNISRGSYLVHYEDKDGNEHEAYVAPNFGDNAKLYEDKIVKYVQVLSRPKAKTRNVGQKRRSRL